MPLQFRRLLSTALASVCLAICITLPSPDRAHAGSLVIPAWSLARGNVRIHANPDEYADAGPVVGGGTRQPWGWTVEYDVEFPVDGEYTLEICYAAAEARPIEVFFNGRNMGKCCDGVTFAPSPVSAGGELTWNSSGAKWEGLRNEWGRLLTLKAAAGVHTVKLTRRAPLPHLVGLRLNTATAFPDDWNPPRFKVRDIESVPAKYRKAFAPRANVDAAALRAPVKAAPKTRPAGSLTIDAWTFDRGNARIYASPEQYADFGPLIGSAPGSTEAGMVEYDIDFPVTAEYELYVKYAAAKARPLDVFVDGKPLAKCCLGVTFGSAPYEHPIRFSWNSSSAAKVWEHAGDKKGRLVKLTIAKGRHTLRLARKGPLPHLLSMRFDSSEAFGKDWKPVARKVRNFDGVPARQRTAFLPADAVNIAALRLAIADTIKTFGSRYPNGQKYLKQLSELEAKQRAAANGPDEQAREIEDALAQLRREAMGAHPALKFDKLLFLKRSSGGYGHTYTDQHASNMGGNLCVLSPVGPGGKVTNLVSELDGGLFDRFDLSWDAKKVVFGYKKKPKEGQKGNKGQVFRIYEIELDPTTGLMKSGSLKQLTFSDNSEAEAIKCHSWQGRGVDRGFDDMDPCYLPDGRIVFASTRSQRNVFCAGSTVTTLYVMDADGKNLHCISASPINETAPSVLDDGRIVYTRWEYVDKGLGNGQSLWAIRPDGSGSDHVFKNNTVRPAGMSNARSIPGSRQIVATGGTHHNTAVGPVILIDARLGRRGTKAMNSLTPEIGYPCMGHPIRKFGFFMDPYPFSEKFFLVAHKTGPKPVVRKAGDKKSRPKPSRYGIYVLDAWGNRAEIVSDPEISCFEPIPLRPRRKPMRLAPVDQAGVKDAKTGTLFLQNVYEGMKGIERGRVKYLRVMGVLKYPWGAHGMNVVGMNVDVHRKKVYGIVKVHEDGSALFRVPAEENIFFHALDENYMALQQMPTLINLMPGEHRSCIGCHELRKKAPNLRIRPTAITRPPQRLVPQPGDKGPRMVHYASDVQPILDKHCVGCHGEKNPKGRLDLTGVPTARYSRSYENIIGKGLISYADCRYGRANFRPVPPLTHGSHRSSLVGQIRKDPCKGKLTQAEFVKIITWIDANAPYYGTYRGKKELKYKDDPEFRLPPLQGKVALGGK
jgi:hypothetical protein